MYKFILLLIFITSNVYICKSDAPLPDRSLKVGIFDNKDKIGGDIDLSLFYEAGPLRFDIVKLGTYYNDIHKLNNMKINFTLCKVKGILIANHSEIGPLFCLNLFEVNHDIQTKSETNILNYGVGYGYGRISDENHYIFLAPYLQLCSSNIVIDKQNSTISKDRFYDALTRSVGLLFKYQNNNISIKSDNIAKMMGWESLFLGY